MRVLIVGGTEHQRAVLRRIYPEANVLDLYEDDAIEAIATRLAALEPIRHIVVLAPEHEFVSPADETLIHEQERGVLSVFRLIKALLARGHGGHELDWTLVTTLAQAVHSRDPVNPVHAALHGLAGSMAKEYPALAHPPDRPGKPPRIGMGQAIQRPSSSRCCACRRTAPEMPGPTGAASGSARS